MRARAPAAAATPVDTRQSSISHLHVQPYLAHYSCTAHAHIAHATVHDLAPRSRGAPRRPPAPPRPALVDLY
eukprot:5860-Prymnesium_polylepis.1